MFDFLSNTMLIERLAGVSVYALVLVYICVKIGGSNNAYNISRYLRIYSFILGIMAFFYIPSQDADIHRWRMIASSWQYLPFDIFWEQFASVSSTPIAYLMIYLCQATLIDGILPMLCAVIFYENVFHIIKKEAVRLECDGVAIALALFFVMSTGKFLEVISGVRCLVAFSIVARLYYDEIFMDRRIIFHVPFYIIACLIHLAVLPLAILRGLFFLLENNGNVVVRMINFALVVCVSLIAMTYGEGYISASFEKAERYISGTSYSYFWEYIIDSLSLICLLYICFIYKLKSTRVFYKEDYIFKLIMVLSLISLYYCYVYSIFHRFIIFAVIISIPLFVRVLFLDANNERRTRTVVLCFSILILFLACARGDLCGYKFFLLD